MLGPVEVRSGELVLRAGRPQQSLVLAALIAEVGRPVPVATLVDWVWGEAPPERARRMLHTHIARVRKLLEQAGVAAIRRRENSYLLDVAPDQVDLGQFRVLVARGTATDRPAVERAELLRQALELWRGEPMAGLSGRWVEQTRQVWLRQRLQTVLDWAGAELAAGHPAAVIERLTTELVEHPLVEPLAAALIRALSEAGRGAEALDCYAAVRRQLAEELGADPGPVLRAAHEAALRGPAAVALPRAGRRARPPAQLPASVPGFIGRDAELDRLDRVLVGAEAAAAVVAGMAGVGKTALAVQWAYRVRDRFPGGQLYINLRGYDPDRPVAPGDALAQLLDGLGVPGPELPARLDERAARFRTEAAGRRLLIVLDNAATVEQVRPLLPGTGPAATVVTSRDSLAGLVAVHGAERIDLDVLSIAAAEALLVQRIGARAEAEPAAVTALVERCARLPLALRIAAELAAARPGTSLAELAAELADEGRRLDTLDVGGDPRAAVTAAFSWSLRHLASPAAAVFRLLGLHPGTEFDRHAVAALAATDPAGAQSALAALARAHLIQPTGRDRYGLHDLLRAYATGLAGEQLSETARRAAVDRLFDHYVMAAAVAADLLYPAQAPHPGRTSGLDTAAVPADADAARQWLDVERGNLVAVATHGRPAHARSLSVALYRYLDGGHRSEALAVHTRADQAARQITDPAERAQAARRLADAHLGLRQPAAAAEHFGRALDLFRQAGDEIGEATVLNGLGRVEQISGRYDRATAYHRRAMVLLERAGDRAGQARAHNKLGAIATRRGRFRSAARHFQQALTAFREAGDETGEAVALNNLGLAEQRLGRYGSAAGHLEEALDRAGRLGNVHSQAGTLDNLGSMHARLGRPDLAADYHRRALTLFTTIGEQDGQAWALNGLGEAAHLAGRPEQALDHYRAALATATETGSADQQARAHSGLGDVLRALGTIADARHHYESALALYISLDAPQAEQVRGELSRI